MFKQFLSFLLISFSFLTFSQKKLTELPEELSESSALVKYDNCFLTINDSGGDNVVFVFDHKGKITNKATIENSKNKDWEALAFDGEKYLYIGDIGNNGNTRKTLQIYRVEICKAIYEASVKAEKIEFSYPEQKEFPPKDSEKYYDAEAMFIKNDEIVVITKNQTKPFDGIAKIYTIPLSIGQHQATLKGEISLSATHWLENSITDAAVFDNNVYLLTYSKIYKFNWESEKPIKIDEYELDNISQKEGIAVDKKYIYLTDENDFKIFKSNYLYRMKRF